MIRYHFDLYPRDDPKNGARLVRFTKLQSAEYRGEANGTGSGRFSIRADTAEAQFIDPAGLQYVRVVREDTVAATEVVVGGFFLDSGDFTALDERGTRLLTFGGAGTLSYLSRSIMASHTYISPIFTGQDPFDDTWRLYAQSTVYANGNFLGAMLWRVIYEAQHNTPGTHRHADGVNVSDTHADDRPAIAIPDLTMGFDQFDDSNGNPWAVSSGEFKAQVGENVLAVVQRLMQAGLYVSMDPDTFELSAYQAATHRRTRTGASWGANVIRFQSPTAEDIDTGNIKSDAKRAIAAFIKRSWLLAGGQDVYGDATGTSDIPWEGFYNADVGDATAAAGIAGIQIGARDDAGDTLRLRIRLGTTPATGYYLPFEHILLDDLVTVHTGTGQWDFNEQTFPVAALTVALRLGGDWDCWVDLGSSYSAAATRQFQVAPVGAHTHPPSPELCRPGTAASAPAVQSVTPFDGISTPENIPLTIGGGTAVALYVGLSSVDSSGTPGSVDSVTWVPDSGSALTDQAFTKVVDASHGGANAGTVSIWRLLNPTPTIADSVVRIAESDLYGVAGGLWFLSGVHQTTPEADTGAATGTGTATSVAVTKGATDLVLDVMGYLANIATQDHTPTGTGHTEDFDEMAARASTDVFGAGGRGSDGTATWTLPASQAWAAVAVSVASSSTGTAGDVPQDVGANDEGAVGTSNRAPRCDHVHAHSDLSDHPTETHHHASSVEFTPTGTIAATDSQAAIAEVATDAAALVNGHTGDATDAHDASAISIADAGGHFTSTDVEGALQEAATMGGGGALDDLTDVTIATPADGQVLTYDSGTGEWVNENSAAGFSNPMTTQGDIIIGGASGTATRLAAGTNGHVLTLASGNPSWAAASGGGWTQIVNESGASFANWTAVDGTWASDGTLIQETGAHEAAHRRAYLSATKVPFGAGFVVQAELRMPTVGGGGNAQASILLGYPGSGTATPRIFIDANANTVGIERDAAAAIRTITGITIDPNTWYTLRVVCSGAYISVYLDGTLRGTTPIVNTTVGSIASDFIGMAGYNCTLDARNISVWTLTLP